MAPFKASQFVLGAALSLAAPLAFAQQYAAIAYNELSGRFGYSYGQASQEEAEERALDECGEEDCEIMVWVQDGCAALARSVSQSDTYGWAWRNGFTTSTMSGAQQTALNECFARAGAGNCYLLTTTCSFW